MVQASEQHSSMRSRQSAYETVSLVDCFDAFRADEQLGEHDMWYCPKCDKHVQAYKKMDIWSLPEVFIVHLKRFQYQQGMYMVLREKISCLVDFPIEALDMSQFVIGPNHEGMVYDLFAVSEHSGGLGGGHYTAIAYNSETKQWYDFNDSSVHPTEARNAVTPQAYVLFYKRRATSSVPAEMETAAAVEDVETAAASW